MSDILHTAKWHENEQFWLLQPRDLNYGEFGNGDLVLTEAKINLFWCKIEWKIAADHRNSWNLNGELMTYVQEQLSFLCLWHLVNRNRDKNATLCA